MTQSADVSEQAGFKASVPDAVRNAFHQAFGEAIASFGGIEAALMFVFTSLLQPANPTRGHDVFRSGIGFKGQLDMISALVVSTDVDGELLQTWKQLRSRRVQSRRNKLAHMHVWQMSGLGLFGYDIKKKIEDLPVNWSRRQHHQSVFTTEKMQAYRQEFDEVARLIVEFEGKANCYVRGVGARTGKAKTPPELGSDGSRFFGGRSSTGGPTLDLRRCHFVLRTRDSHRVAFLVGSRA